MSPSQVAEEADYRSLYDSATWGDATADVQFSSRGKAPKRPRGTLQRGPRNATNQGDGAGTLLLRLLSDGYETREATPPGYLSSGALTRVGKDHRQ
jgi:hypothetical protein